MWFSCELHAVHDTLVPSLWGSLFRALYTGIGPGVMSARMDKHASSLTSEPQPPQTTTVLVPGWLTLLALLYVSLFGLLVG